MKTSLLTKLDALADRHEEVAALLGDADTAADQNRFRDLSKEFAHLNEVVTQHQRWTQLQETVADARQMLNDPDAELRELAAEEIAEAERELTEIEAALQVLLLPQDPSDSSNVFLEIRAGTGGDEAAIFSGDLFRMYHRYAEQKGWSVEVLSERSGELGGFKEVISRVLGRTSTVISSLNRALIEFSVSLKRNLRDGYILLPVLSRCYRKLKKSTALKSEKKIFGSTRSAHRGRAVSTSTRQIQRCG